MTSLDIIQNIHQGTLDKRVKEVTDKAAQDQKHIELWQSWTDLEHTSLFLGSIVKRISELESNNLTNHKTMSEVELHSVLAEWSTLQKVINLANTGNYA